jgi:hypothetical protein
MLSLVGMTACSIVGRLLLMRAAFSISKGWGVSVLLVPLAPMFFRLNYKELAHEGKNWRMATILFTVLFFIVGGSGSPSDIPAMLSHREEASVLAEVGPANGASAAASPAAAKAGPVPVVVAKGLIAKVVALVHPAATPAPVVPKATPAPPTLAERTAANQREFARLEEVYEHLKTERGYLRKADDAGIAAYNTEAAKYHAAVAAARAEQTELNKQLLAKK